MLCVRLCFHVGCIYWLVERCGKYNLLYLCLCMLLASVLGVVWLAHAVASASKVYRDLSYLELRTTCGIWLLLLNTLYWITTGWINKQQACVLSCLCVARLSRKCSDICSRYINVEACCTCCVLSLCIYLYYLKGILFSMLFFVCTPRLTSPCCLADGRAPDKVII